MNRESMKVIVAHVIKTLENAQQSLQFTNIPIYVLVDYIKKETGIDIEDIKIS